MPVARGVELTLHGDSDDADSTQGSLPLEWVSMFIKIVLRQILRQALGLL